MQPVDVRQPDAAEEEGVERQGEAPQMLTRGSRVLQAAMRAAPALTLIAAGALPDVNQILASACCSGGSSHIR